MQDGVVDKIKERISVMALIGEYVKLEKAGTNYRALCPFHNEKTPSFMVNPERNFWYCFGCQKGGDIFTFLQDMEGLEFRDALERLAEKAGVDLPQYSGQGKEQFVQIKSKKQKAYDILEIATKVYQHQLEKSDKGLLCKEYLKKRNLTEIEIEKFRLGYSPNAWTVVLDFLKKRKYTVEEVATTGLLVQKNENGLSESKVYDRFRDRIMYPIIDVAGKVLGYSARVAPEGNEKNAKYINTNQTIVYDKSKVLYGLYQARSAMKKKDFVIVVEGNMDVISSHRAGVENVVAVSGTALSSHQIDLISRYTKNVKLCFDMDDAGQKATKKSIQSFLSFGFEVEIIQLLDGFKDVNDLIVKDLKLWNDSIEKASPAMEYFFNFYFKKYDVNKPKDKKVLASELLNIIKDISDLIEQNYWIKKLSTKLAVDESLLTSILEKVKIKERNSNNVEERSENLTFKKPERFIQLEEKLLALFALCPEELLNRADSLNLEILSEKSRKVWEKIKNGDDSVDKELNELSLKEQYIYDKQGFIKKDIDYKKEWDLALNEVVSLWKESEMKKISLALKRAEDENNEELIEDLMLSLSKFKDAHF